MGQWLCRFLAGEGFEVIAADRDEKALREAEKVLNIKTTSSNIGAVKRANVIIVSVPINGFEETIKEIAPFIRTDQTVIDVTSVKAGPVSAMHRYIKKGLILGAHPLFGPGVSGIKGENFVLTPANDKEKTFALEVEKYLKERGAGVKIMPPEDHDRLMAVVQGLSHFVAIASADALRALGPLKEMKEAATTTFGIFLNYIKSVIGDDPELYAAIQMSHPNMAEIYRTLTRSVEKWSGIVNRKDMNGFVEGMRELNIYTGNNYHPGS